MFSNFVSVSSLPVLHTHTHHTNTYNTYNTHQFAPIARISAA